MDGFVSCLFPAVFRRNGIGQWRRLDKPLLDLKIYGLDASVGVEVAVFEEDRTGRFPARGAPMATRP